MQYKSVVFFGVWICDPSKVARAGLRSQFNYCFIHHLQQISSRAPIAIHLNYHLPRLSELDCCVLFIGGMCEQDILLCSMHRWHMCNEFLYIVIKLPNVFANVTRFSHTHLWYRVISDTVLRVTNVFTSETQYKWKHLGPESWFRQLMTTHYYHD
jgi:hypothetical protein